MAATAAAVGSVPAPSSLSRGPVTRAGLAPSVGGSGSLSSMVEAIVGTPTVHGRSSGERPPMEDFGAHTGDRGRTPPRAPAGNPETPAGGPGPGPLTLFQVDEAAGRTVASEPTAPMPVLSQITYGVGVYDRAIQAVAGMRPSDLLGQRVNRSL